MRGFFHRLPFFIGGILFLPLVWALARGGYRLLVDAQMHDDGSRVLLFFFLGFALWLLVFAFLPRPTRSYILAHELSHALWAWMMGAKVRNLRVGRDGGSVVVSRSNLLITLAPYFFPFYSFLTLLLFGLLSLWARPAGWLLPSLMGFTWAYHLSFTVLALGTRQSDIQAYGAVCSFTTILVGNLLLLDLALVLATPIRLARAWAVLSSETLSAYSAVLRVLQRFLVQ